MSTKHSPQRTGRRLRRAFAALLLLASTCAVAAPQAQAAAGRFPLTLKNNTGGKWSDAQVYVTMLGMPEPGGKWHYLKPDGTFTPINHNDETAPGHLTKKGRNYANMSFTLAQASTVTMPPSVYGGRIYLSLGSPMYLPIAADDSGWGGPDLNNPADPNADVYLDWYEYTFANGKANFGGNTTQVDMFGFPMTARLQQSSTGYDQTVGITASRDQVFSRYSGEVGAAFKPLAGTHRILAPSASALFAPGGAQANYFQSTIDQVWSKYAGGFTLTRLGQKFTGKVSGDTLTFTKDGSAPQKLGKPTTKDVVTCSGALASPGMSSIELELGAEFCAAFNRGVAQDTAKWYTPSAYYTGTVQNDYAKFFHSVGIDHRAYGFAYDDINDQSSVKILDNSNPPSALTLSVGW
ncbi:glycoside hydrolase family 64 protein [Amycolatopsis sp. NPDC059021]|uniref:glycoside hydrolase family 64 protein n=1 Tax=Amycolatopsis sp. NPDC059021 TaxID=3346704 RepID=UPI00366D7343